MNSFTPSPTPAAPLDPTGAQVVADGWFPPVPLADVRARHNLGGGAVTTAMLTGAIQGAMLTGFRALAAWRTARVLAGAAELADVTTDTLDGINRAELLWLRAVGFYAAADLAAAHRDISATDNGLARSAEKAALSEEYRREGHAAIADLLSIGGASVSRNRVEML